MKSLQSFSVTDIFYETQRIPFHKIITVIHLHLFYYQDIHEMERAWRMVERIIPCSLTSLSVLLQTYDVFPFSMHKSCYKLLFTEFSYMC